jgi:hypothetical protein
VTAGSNIWSAYEARRSNYHYAEGNRIARGDANMAEAKRLFRGPQIVMLVLTILTWAGVGYGLYNRPPIGSSLFTLWGGGPTSSCTSMVDGTQLKEWQSDYSVVIFCGVSDPTLDRLEDTRITMSRPFHIVPSSISVSAPFSPAMVEGFRSEVAPMFAANPQATGMSNFLWYQAAVIPKTCDPSNIHRLSDVGRNGGILMPEVPETIIVVSKDILNQH